MSRNSRWTSIYWDVIDGKMKAYIRFVPDFLDTEAAGFSHGISMGGVSFNTEVEANQFADHIDYFMEKMAIQLEEEFKEKYKIPQNDE